MLKITVGVPIFNQKKSYFIECLKSIKDQTCQDFECIILDDGSNNKKEVEKITKEFGFKYIYQKNSGIGEARQAIVDNSSKETEYICFLSSDDVWDEKFLEVMIKTAKEQPKKILYSSSYHIDEEGRIIMKFNPPTYDSHEDFCLACLGFAHKNNMFVNFSTTFFPKEVFEKCKFKYRFGEDLYFLLISMKHFKYFLVSQHLLKYRAVNNLTSRIRHKIGENNNKIIKEVLEYWKNG